MAAAAAAALLDELMGRNRNVAPNEKGVELNWEDPEYCKFYMVKFCPHDLFINTRADLGNCTKLHDDEAKKMYEQSSSARKVQCLDEFIRFCTSILNDVQRKIEKGKHRLLLMNANDKAPLTPAQTQKNQDQITLLSDKIDKLVEEAEAAGIKGNVEQAQGLMKLCDQLKEERNVLKKANENSCWQETANLAAEQEKQMEVCEVCGAFLIIGDAQQRIDDHLMGKQHVGYAKLKVAIEEVSKERAAMREEREKKRDVDRRERYSAMGGARPSNGRREDRDKDRGRNTRERERDRDNSKRHRDDARDRDRERDREKRRERVKDTDRDRDHRYKKDKDRRDRRSDKDKDSDHRSRARDDDRSSSRRRERSKERKEPATNGEEHATVAATVTAAD